MIKVFWDRFSAIVDWTLDLDQVCLYIQCSSHAQVTLAGSEVGTLHDLSEFAYFVADLFISQTDTGKVRSLTRYMPSLLTCE